MSPTEIILQYYPARVNSKRPIGETDLAYFMEATKNPSEAIKDTFKAIAAAELADDMKRKAELKQENLYYLTPCVYTDGKGRSYTNILKWNGIAVLDFDHIENAEQFKIFMFNKYKAIFCAYLSPSKKGVKFLVSIPLCTSTDEFKTYYYGLGCQMDRYKGWDGTGQNCILPLFLSWDENLLYRQDPEVWTKKGQKADFYAAKTSGTINIDTKDADKKRILENCQKAFLAITTNGHPQMRAACISLGGYVAAGYLDESEAIQFVNNLIESNGYLSKGVSGYKKTAKAAIGKGQEKAIIL